MDVDLRAEKGVVIIEVLPNSPAAVGNLQPLDVIVAVDNEEVTSMPNLRKILFKYRIGDRATLTINRNGTVMRIPVTFREF